MKWIHNGNSYGSIADVQTQNSELGVKVAGMNIRGARPNIMDASV